MATSVRLYRLLLSLDSERHERTLAAGIGQATILEAIAGKLMTVTFSKIHGRRYRITPRGLAALREQEMSTARRPAHERTAKR